MVLSVQSFTNMYVICGHFVLEMHKNLYKFRELYNKVESINIMGTAITKEKAAVDYSLESFGSCRSILEKTA